MIPNITGTVTAGPYSPKVDYAKKDPDGYTVEVVRDLVFSKGILKEKIKQFKLGKYTEKYIKTYLDFILMEGIVTNLEYLEFLKEIGTN